MTEARDMLIGLFAGAAVTLFLMGAAFAAFGGETAGAVCMVLAFLMSGLATIAGYNAP